MSFKLTKEYQKGMDSFNRGCVEYVSCHTKSSHFITTLKDKPIAKKWIKTVMLVRIVSNEIVLMVLNKRWNVNFISILRYHWPQCWEDENGEGKRDGQSKMQEWRSVLIQKTVNYLFLQLHVKCRNIIGFIFSWWSEHITSDIIFIVCTLIDDSYEPISTWKFWQLL